MSTQYHYGKFPPAIPQQELLPLLSQARTELGRYDGLLSAIKNSDALLAPLLRQEAVLSSRIEGTQSSLSDVLEYEADDKSREFSAREEEDIREIINYQVAINTAVEMLKARSLDMGVLKDTHAILMRGVRGQDKDPGKIREKQNWIGYPGCSIEDATFVPVSVEKLSEALSAWEGYIHASDDVDNIVKAAVLHAEFEALHPFRDGNGRLGRIFIPLFLWKQGLIRKPHFYMSAYFERNRSHYYDALLEVSKSGAWVEWCRFFITGVMEEAKSNSSKAQSILRLYDDLKVKIPAMTKSQYGITALDYIFAKPYFNSSQFYTEAAIPRPTAQRLLRIFREEGVLVGWQGAGRTPSLHIFRDLMKIAQG